MTSKIKKARQTFREKGKLLFNDYSEGVSWLVERPGRSEPRAVKRRPKPYQLLTAPPHEMKVIPNRGGYNAKHP